MNREVKKYAGTTKDGYFIESDNIEHFRLEELTHFMVTETLTRDEVDKIFGRYYAMPKNVPLVSHVIVSDGDGEESCPSCDFPSMVLNINPLAKNKKILYCGNDCGYVYIYPEEPEHPHLLDNSN